jgi:hypothetical protein
MERRQETSSQKSSDPDDLAYEDTKEYKIRN